MACIVPYYIYIIIFKDSYPGDPKETSIITQIYWITEFISAISTSNKKYLTIIFRRILPYYINIITIGSYSWVKCSFPLTFRFLCCEEIQNSSKQSSSAVDIYYLVLS